jgi:uncharacterized protein YndB with AHSA1/START domain
MDLTITAKETRSVTHNTFVLERTYPATPERVYAALANPAKKRGWFVDGEGHEVEQFEMDFRPGGSERIRFRFVKGPLQNATLSNDAKYEDILPNRRVVISSTMSIDDRRISASLVTFELLPDEKGTLLTLTNQGAYFEGADGPEMRQAGWRKLLDSLSAELARDTGTIG